MSEELYVKCEICGKGFDNYPSLIAHLYQHIKELRQNIKELQDAILKLQGALEEAEKYIYKPSEPSRLPWKPITTEKEQRWKVSRWESW
jgi:hypothetical protein